MALRSYPPQSVLQSDSISTHPINVEQLQT